MHANVMVIFWCVRVCVCIKNFNILFFLWFEKLLYHMYVVISIKVELFSDFRKQCSVYTYLYIAEQV